MKRICEKSGIKKRHFHYTAQTIAEHPEFLDRAAPSLDARLRITQDAVPELAVAAAAKAIAEWGRPATDITHLVLTTNSSAHAPGADLRLAAVLGLRPTVQRTQLYLHGCFGGCSALRVANQGPRRKQPRRAGARGQQRGRHGVNLLRTGHTPTHSSPWRCVRRWCWRGHNRRWGSSTSRAPDLLPGVCFAGHTLPGTEHALSMQLGTSGMEPGISAEVPALLRGTIKGCLADMLAPLGLPVVPGAGWNGLFWGVHPGGRAILDSCETALSLEDGKLAASRHVLSEYGNMLGATGFFVLDEIRRRRQDGDGDCEFGIKLGIGPGITVEMMVLQAAGSQGRKS